jgi:hypothetical protein
MALLCNFCFVYYQPRFVKSIIRSVAEFSQKARNLVTKEEKKKERKREKRLKKEQNRNDFLQTS